MSATGATRSSAVSDNDHGHSHASAHRGPVRRSTETKAAFKTTEFIAFLAVLAGILIAGAIISGDGANDPDFFGATKVWLYATILTSAYVISRGLAKAGSRDPYTDDDRS